MELKDFVSASLKGIIEGIAEAQKHAATMGALINPQYIAASPAHYAPTTHSPIGRVIEPVEFDIALTVTDTAENKGGVGVVATVIAVGGSRTSEKSTETLSRIKFSIPVSFPLHQLD